MEREIYIVIGGSGFLGRHIVEALLNRGDTVSILDVVQRYHDVPFYSADISVQSQVEDALRKVRCKLFPLSIVVNSRSTEWGNLHNSYSLTSSWARPCYLLESERRGH